MNSYDACWLSGNYSGEDCYFCPYKSQCSGSSCDDDYDDYDDDDDD